MQHNLKRLLWRPVAMVTEAIKNTNGFQAILKQIVSDLSSFSYTELNNHTQNIANFQVKENFSRENKEYKSITINISLKITFFQFVKTKIVFNRQIVFDLFFVPWQYIKKIMK